MSQVWNLQDPPVSPRARLLAGRIAQLLGRHFPGIENEFRKHLSLWEYLMANKNVPAANLRNRVLEKGKPVFTVDEMKAIMNIVRKQAPPAKVGGAAAPLAKEEKDAEGSDPSRSKFWDKFIRKITHPITKYIPASFDTLFWFFFILYNLEQMEIVGPAIATMLDTVTLSLPVVADMTSDVTSSLIELAPIPYAGIVGDMLGYAISLFFISVAVTMNMSRRHFGSAFKASLEAIPMFGDVLSEGAQSFEIAAERYLQHRNRTLASIGKISPKAEKFLDYYVPDADIKTGPAPPWDMPGMKMNVVQYAAREAGISEDGSMALPTISSEPPIVAVEEDATAEEEKGGLKKIVGNTGNNKKTEKTNDRNNKTVTGGRHRLRLRRTRKHKNKYCK